MTWLVRLRFDGSAYCGWQTQKNGPSVQVCVMDCLRRIFGSVERFSGCSRTDAGVHALGFCASFSVPGEMEPERLIRAMNANLPRDIAVFEATPVPEDFHARYRVKSKTYLYLTDPSPVRSPFLENRVWNRPGEYDPAVLNRAASYLVGTHDFRSFMAAGSRISDCTRTVFSASFEQRDGLLRFSVSADGFLYHMVRIMVGTLLDVPRRFPPEQLEEILGARDRSAAGPTAPACGLYLEHVDY